MQVKIKGEYTMLAPGDGKNYLAASITYKLDCGFWHGFPFD